MADWRHQEVWYATGETESLTKATQDHYVSIYNRLAAYLGEPPIKDRTWSEMDKAIHNLRDAMRRYETNPDYLAEIVRDQLHLPCTGRDVYQAPRNFLCCAARPVSDVHGDQPGPGGCAQTGHRDWPGDLRATR